jgi:hypothetical protein
MKNKKNMNVKFAKGNLWVRSEKPEDFAELAAAGSFIEDPRFSLLLIASVAVKNLHI